MAAVWFLGLCGLAELVPGLWHSLLPDGGAGVIVGLGLTQHAELIVRVFAWLARL